jgi:hypothetical protein
MIGSRGAGLIGRVAGGDDGVSRCWCLRELVDEVDEAGDEALNGADDDGNRSGSRDDGSVAGSRRMVIGVEPPPAVLAVPSG